MAFVQNECQGSAGLHALDQRQSCRVQEVQQVVSAGAAPPETTCWTSCTRQDWR